MNYSFMIQFQNKIDLKIYLISLTNKFDNHLKGLKFNHSVNMLFIFEVISLAK